MTTREQAIAWWNVLSNAGRMAFCNKMDSDRFKTVGIPPWPDPTVTGREIEQMWEMNRPSTSMDIRELGPDDLMGRVVKVTGGPSNITMFSFVKMVSDSNFRVFNCNATFKVRIGSQRGRGTEPPFLCELASREEWDKFADEERAKTARKRLVDDIIKQAQRSGYLASTDEQLKAAAEALGLVKV